MDLSPWFIAPRRNAEAEARLFCFPYAGGGIPVFRGWAEALPGVEVCVASLPGRGSRLHERPLSDLATLVEQLEQAFRPPDGKPFAFYGHSLGARLAFELAQRLRNNEQPLPAHLFLAACPAPHCPRRAATIHALPRDALIAALQGRGALPDDVVTHPELLQLVLPALQADIALLETAQYREQPPLPCPITVFGASGDDQVSQAELAAWSAHTTAAFQQLLIPGAHLFLHESRELLLQMIRENLPAG
jgi:medium-chain acyl-[acyl-carrier-protein] hydrolase